MESTTGSPTSLDRYPDLCDDVQLLIIDQFLLDYLDEPSFPREPKVRRGLLGDPISSRKPLAKYATVDRLWKSVIEKITFREISVRVSDIQTANSMDNTNDLDRLERICVGPRIDLVSEIFIEVFLDDDHSQNTESSEYKIAAMRDQEPQAATIVERQCSALDAERICTTVFGRLFGILKNWSRRRRLLSLKYHLGLKSTGKPQIRRRFPVRNTHLRIDASSFPEVTCIGDFITSSNWLGWGIQPESTLQVLTKLPKTRRAHLSFGTDVESQVAGIVKEGQPPIMFRKSNFDLLWLSCNMRRPRPSAGRPDGCLSLQHHQSIFALCSSVRLLTLTDVVDVPCFLRESWRANVSTPHSLPAWPNLQALRILGHPREEDANEDDTARDLHASITHALPQMPNLIIFNVSIDPLIPRGHCISVIIGVPPRRDRSVMPDAELFSCGIEPDPKTVNTWKKLVRSQWYCGLRKANRDLTSRAIYRPPQRDRDLPTHGSLI